ncbi:hypothetical protein GGR54DRAFT_209184 [Hypoxylon sp. NC1633]|nr:hypothetical protein GGR54DRAFT_209184 [Hypoxylon sp. NC1633]
MKVLTVARHVATISRNKCMKIWKKQRRQSNPECFILELPPKLIILISESLDPASRAVFSQTCSLLYTILRVAGKVPTGAELPRSQYIEYLSLLSRDLPAVWLCEVCAALHPISKRDTPTRPQDMTCPLGWNEWRNRAYLKHRSCRLDKRLVDLDHRHVQLALKYARTWPLKYRTYLRHLTAPYHDTDFDTHVYPQIQRSILHAQYSAFPRIVAGANGGLRFLLLSVWRYHNKADEATTLEDMGDLKICPHLAFYPNFPPQSEWPICAVGKAINAVLRAPDAGSEVRGSCARCTTDFSVRVCRGRRDYVELRAWQDLGPETSPLDLAWRVHTRTDSEFLDYRPPCFMPWTPVLHHDPGSVRRLYEASPDPKSGCPGEDVVLPRPVRKRKEKQQQKLKQIPH